MFERNILFVCMILPSFLPYIVVASELYGLVGEYNGIFVFEASRENFAFIANFTPYDQLTSTSVNGNRVTTWFNPNCIFEVNLFGNLSPSIKDSVLQVKQMLTVSRDHFTIVQSKPDMYHSINNNDSDLKGRLMREVFSMPLNGTENGGGLSKVMSHANGVVIFVYVDQKVLMKPVNCLNQFEEDFLANCVSRLDKHRKYMEEWNHYKMPEGQDY